MNNYRRFIAILSLTFFSLNAAASIQLDSTSEGGAGSFDAELLEAADNPKVGIVLMHGRCANGTGPVVEELRNSLYHQGYTTLSIWGPLTSDGGCSFASYTTEVSTIMPEVYARARTAIDYLQELGVEQIVMLGFSLGSRFATAHVARGQQDELPIVALVGIGMYATSDVDPLDHDYTLDEVDVPVLDIFGDEDYNALDTMQSRRSAYESGEGQDYTQLIFDCASNLSTNDCHKLVGHKGSDDGDLEVAVYDWLQCHAPLAEQDCSNVPQDSPVPETRSSKKSSTSFLAMQTSTIFGVLLILLISRRKEKSQFGRF